MRKLSVASRRATARIAWRDALRAPARAGLVVALVALPLASFVASSSLDRTASPTKEEAAASTYGTADLRVQIAGSRSRLVRALPEGSTVFDVRETVATSMVRGAIVELVLEEALLDRPPTAPMYRLIRGRAPRARGEVALAPRALEAFGAGIGDSIATTHPPMSLRVTGVVLRPENLEDARLAVVAPGSLRRRYAADAEYLVELPPGHDPAMLAEDLINRSIISSYSARTEAAASSILSFGAPLVVAVLLLFGSGLVVAAAFGTGMRRRLRALGLVLAAGGEIVHVRQIVVMGGVLLGGIGAAVGTILGLAVALAATPLLPSLVGRETGPLDVPAWAVGVAIALGLLTAVMAALVPARAAARVTPLDALAARIPRPRPPGRISRAGALTAAAGALISVGAVWNRNEPALAFGVVLMTSGVLLAIPLAVAALGRVSSRLRGVWLIAARSAARNGRRTGAAVAAATAALMFPVAVSALTLSDEAYGARDPLLLRDQIVATDHSLAGEGAVPSIEPALRRAFPAALVARMWSAGFSPRGYAVDGPGRLQDMSVFVASDPVAGEMAAGYQAGELTLGDESLLRAVHAADALAAFRAGKVIGIGSGSVRRQIVQIPLPTGATVRAPLRGRARTVQGIGDDQFLELPAVASRAPAVDHPLIQYVMSEKAARRYGLERAGGQNIIVRLPRAMSDADLERARDVAAAHPFTFVLSHRDGEPTSARLRLLLTAASVLAGVIIVIIAVALVFAESRRERLVLAAVGAGPRARRAIAAATAALLGLLAAVLAVPAGFLPVAVVQWARAAPYPVIVPWATIGVVVVVVPPVVALVGAMIAPRAAGRDAVRALA